MTTAVKTSEAVLVAVAKTIKGTSFIGIPRYENSKGEVSKYTLLVGINFANVLKSDMLSLLEKKSELFIELAKNHKVELIAEAYDKVFKSLENRLASDEIKELLREENNETINRSDAQKEAFIHLAKGVKKHIATNVIYVHGLQIKKTVLEPIEYKAVNSKELTIVQNKIRKFCDFKQEKYKTFKYNANEIKIQGVTL